MCSAVDSVNAMMNEIVVTLASATPQPISVGATECSIAGSARKPMPRLAIVMPSWVAAM
jgi:hypothetical protein